MQLMKILVIDDEQDICEILQYNLETEGFEVASACINTSARRNTKLTSAGCDDGRDVGIPDGTAIEG